MIQALAETKAEICELLENLKIETLYNVAKFKLSNGKEFCPHIFIPAKGLYIFINYGDEREDEEKLFRQEYKHPLFSFYVKNKAYWGISWIKLLQFYQNLNWLQPHEFLRSKEKQQALVKDYALYAFGEIQELLNSFDWKSHRANPEFKYQRSATVGEYIDFCKYAESIGLILDIDTPEFLKEFEKKTRVVEQRYQQEKVLNLLNDENIIGVDLDGCLASYHAGFLEFVKLKTGKIVVDSGKLRLWDDVSEVIGVEKMEEIKHLYRDSGIKANLPLIEGAVKGMQELKKLGYKIVILSSRPYHLYPRIFSDTQQWLEKNSIPYDAIFFAEDKDQKIIKRFPKLKFFIEDNGSFALNIALKGYKVFLLEKTYNAGPNHQNIMRVKNWNEVIRGVKNGTKRTL